MKSVSLSQQQLHNLNSCKTIYLTIVALNLLTYMPQGASYNHFGTKLGQCDTTDVDHF